jgi:ribonuclease BN (tRNA processing enzyme)
MPDKKIKITFAGCGSFFAGPDMYQSNIVIEAPSGKRLLFDCGTHAQFSLGELGLSFKDFDAVWVSHLHADHHGGLEWLGFGSYFTASPWGSKKPHLFADATLMTELWDNALLGGMQCIQERLVDMTEYFDCMPVPEGHWFWWEGIRFFPVRTIHVLSGRRLKPSYGLYFQQAKKGDTRFLPPPANRKGDGPFVFPPSGPPAVDFDRDSPKIYITSDTQFCPHLRNAYKTADVVFHDCETAPYNSGVHATYDELRTLPEEVRKKTWLYHYQADPKQVPGADGFPGFVKKGQVFEF